jgi:hypothetical protein
MRAKFLRRGPVVGLVAGLLTMVLLNLLVPHGGIVTAQDEPTPTPVGVTPVPTPTATPSPTPLPSLDIQATAQLTPEGDLDGTGIVNPGDTLLVAVRVSNAGEATGPVQVVASYDRSFVSGISGISGGGTADEAQVVWNLDGLPAGGDISLSFQLQLNRIFPPGRTQVAGTVVVRSATVELRRAAVPAFEVVGPNLRLVDHRVELVTDANDNSRIDPGDTVRVILFYSNTGGGPSQVAALVADYPEELTQALISNPDGAAESPGLLTWAIGSIPPDGEVRSVQFSVQLAPEFSSGIVTYDVLARVEVATGIIDQRPLSVNIAGPNLVASVSHRLLIDQGENGLIDAGDQIEITVRINNVGTDTATAVNVNATFDPAIFDVTEVRSGSMAEGVVAWTLPLLDPGASGELSVVASIRSVPVAVESLRIPVAVASDQTPLASVEGRIPVNAPTPTPEGTPPPGSVIQETRPSQGQGILSVPSVSILIGAFLFLSLLSLVFVASRVLPDTSAERMEVDTEAERAGQRELVRELIEGVVLTAILFTVMILGIQNALDRESINAIIGGIVGYVAGRVTSPR